MFWIPELCFILCTIPLLNGASIKIDGQVNFGDKWNYEYRVYTTDGTALRIGKEETAAEQIKKIEELLLKAQKKFQDVSLELQDKEPEEYVLDDKQGLRGNNKTSHAPAVHKTKKDVERNMITKIPEDFSGDGDSNINSDSASDLIKDSDSDDNEPTKKPKKALRISSEHEKSDPDETDAKSYELTESESSVEKIPNISDYNIHIVEPKPDILEYNIHQVDPKIKHVVAKSAIRTHEFNKEAAEIYKEAVMIEQDGDVTKFMLYIYNDTLQLFRTVKNKAKISDLKELIDEIEKSYMERFREFLIQTSRQKIKTRLGKQKVILNSIETSNGFLNRLTKYLANDKTQEALSSSLAEERKKSETQQYSQACKQFGICLSESSFSVFIANVLNSILACDDERFRLIRDALTEQIKYYNVASLKHEAQVKLKRCIDSFERMDVHQARPVVSILVNTIIQRNKPISITRSRREIENSTLAVFEIIDLLDANIVENSDKGKTWAQLESNFDEFSNIGTEATVKTLINDFVANVKHKIEALDDLSKTLLMKHVATVLKVS